MSLALAWAVAVPVSVAVMTVSLVPVQTYFDASRAYASAPYALVMTFFALGGLLMGRLFDRYGAGVPVFLGSLFLGAETPLGPVYLAAGLGEGGVRAFYLLLGRTF